MREQWTPRVGQRLAAASRIDRQEVATREQLVEAAISVGSMNVPEAAAACPTASVTERYSVLNHSTPSRGPRVAAISAPIVCMRVTTASIG